MKTGKRILSVLLVGFVLFGFMSISVSKITANAAYENTDSSYNYPLRVIANTGRGFTNSHAGVDLSVSKGTAVYSSKKGTVKIVYTGCKNYNGAGSSGQDCKAKGCTQDKTYMSGSGYKAGEYCNLGFGNGVVVQNDDGKFCYYAHLNSVSVKAGDKVTPSTKLGEVGSSGCSTGAHLHFAIRGTATGGTKYNPFDYIFPGFKIQLTNNTSGSLNPRFQIYFPWKDFTITKCQISFGTSSSSLSKTSSDSNVTIADCYYDLGKKFGNLTSGKTYYVKVAVTKDGKTFNSKVYSFVAGAGNKTFLDYSSVANSKVTVTFNANGGTGSATKVDFIAGEIYGDTMPSATRNGYTFDGWYTSVTGGSRVTRGSTVTSGNKTLYAQWIKNQSGLFEVGKVYRIYNENSGLVLATSGSGEGVHISQRNLGEKGKGELWRVINADSDGYYKFENLNGCKVMDLDADDKWGYGEVLQVYSQNTHDAQKFSIIKRENKAGYSGLYSIHCKNNGRAVDVTGKSMDSGAEIHSWDYHGSTNQLFYFEEVTGRDVIFYDNLNNNYIVSPKEEYENLGSNIPVGHYSSRNTDYLKVTIKPESNSIVIDSLKVGSSGNDLMFYTSVNGAYNYDFYELNDATMELKFKARSSVSGAKIYFRWGFEKAYKSVELSTEWKDYTVELPRDKECGGNIHPYIDKVCTVEMADIALYEKGVEGYIGDADFYTRQVETIDIYDDSFVIPYPTKEKEGYVFDGWYTCRAGGKKVADAYENYDPSCLVGAQQFYAHWIPCEHVYSGIEIIQEANHISDGIIKYSCELCGYSYNDIIEKTKDHNYTAIVTTQPTCTKTGIRTYECACGASYTESIEVIPHNSNTIIPAVAATCTSIGFTEGKKCSVCGTITVTQENIDKRAHTDNNKDGKCDSCDISVAVPHIHSYIATSVVLVSCEDNGYTTYACACGSNYQGDIIPATGHSFEGNNEECSICGYNRTDDCSCNCHKSGIAKFFFNIILFFQKLFGMNEECGCGVAHY